MVNVKESDLASSLGLDRKKIRTLRETELTEGVDYTKIGRDIVIREQGVEKLRRTIEKLPVKTSAIEGVSHGSALLKKALGGVLGRLEAKDDSPAQSDQTANAHRVRVTRIWPNVRFLQGELPGGSKVRVRVKSNKRFRVGMEIEVVHEQEDLYSYNGPLPNSRGKIVYGS